MTGQIPDKIIYDNISFELVGVKGDGLYEPLDFGLMSVPPHTANWRGFVNTYKVFDSKLYFEELQVSIKDGRREYPEINGVKPESRQQGLIHLDYKHLNLIIKFTGKIIIAKDLIDSMYVHMGFQSPLSFERIVELEFNPSLKINIKKKRNRIYYPVGENTPAKTSHAKNVLETKLSTIYIRSPYK